MDNRCTSSASRRAEFVLNISDSWSYSSFLCASGSENEHQYIALRRSSSVEPVEFDD